MGGYSRSGRSMPRTRSAAKPCGYPTGCGFVKTAVKTAPVLLAVVATIFSSVVASRRGSGVAGMSGAEGHQFVRGASHGEVMSRLWAGVDTALVGVAVSRYLAARAGATFLETGVFAAEPPIRCDVPVARGKGPVTAVAMIFCS